MINQEQEFRDLMKGVFEGIPSQEQKPKVLTPEQHQLSQEILTAKLKELHTYPKKVTTENIYELLLLKELLQ